ncbi:hypothetical protein HBA55_25400 [Pseudomaricurvus alkylphenolicus]|uniref:hypothetical protein n=1 Tax=Pseudomaricurvus alkylphenolicus TaxID=1306991 RepID=UPI001421D866|nr:hypothetical protein [Pseudomaricurvus alkylphenolicus]NIB42969.1 hypothetical protein [Pseudomaricurvus alkylphenolicus]
MTKNSFIFAFTVTIALLTGCASQNSHVLAGGSQVELRSIQTRSFDSNDRTKMLRSIVATTQDLGFIVDKADSDLGTVTATKLSGYQIRMTITVRPKGDSQLLVRANATYNLQAIEDPQPYQDFFNSLSKAVFLTAHNVD